VPYREAACVVGASSRHDGACHSRGASTRASGVTTCNTRAGRRQIAISHYSRFHRRPCTLLLSPCAAQVYRFSKWCGANNSAMCRLSAPTRFCWYSSISNLQRLSACAAPKTSLRSAVIVDVCPGMAIRNKQAPGYNRRRFRCQSRQCRRQLFSVQNVEILEI
jgi:hypothetical protein